MATTPTARVRRVMSRVLERLDDRRVQVVLGLVLPCVWLGVNMARVWPFTVDDAYISFRYARNLAQGLGLVYNAGEPIEGYTNFLWTVLVALGFKLGLDPNALTKTVGATCALGTMIAVYGLSRRILPMGKVPCLSTWLLATAAPFSGYAVFGLETAAFSCAVTWGLLLVLREEDGAAKVPWSGLVFAAAALLRPEAPLFFGAAMLSVHPRRYFARHNLTRAGLFLLPVLAHLLWRHHTYGLWVPWTFVAKTGDRAAQLDGGLRYLKDYLEHAGPILYVVPPAMVWVAVRAWRPGLSLALAALAWPVYVALVGGDWMSFFRFMAPIEPTLFLLAGVALRALASARPWPLRLLPLVILAYTTPGRLDSLREAQRVWMLHERTFWRNTAGQTAAWLLRHPKGTVGIGDIGYVGYATDYPLLDLLGLVDPVIGRLPGGYTRKLGPGFTDRIFSVAPRYLVFILSGQNCDRPEMAGSRRIFHDPRFAPSYRLAHNIQVGADVSWCIFERTERPVPRLRREPGPQRANLHRAP